MTHTDDTRVVVLVVGMHRSGTSLITQIIHLMGAKLPKNLLGAIKGENDEGFWEPVKIIRLNDEILRFCQSTWDDILPIYLEKLGVIQRKIFVERIKNLIQAEYYNEKFFVLKDPRISRLLPLYIEAFSDLGIEIKFIFSLRHPSSSIISLISRNKFTSDRAEAIWRNNIESALQSIDFNNCTVVNYEEILQNFDLEIRKIWASHKKFQINNLDVAIRKARSAIHAKLDHSKRSPGLVCSKTTLELYESIKTKNMQHKSRCTYLETDFRNMTTKEIFEHRRTISDLELRIVEQERVISSIKRRDNSRILEIINQDLHLKNVKTEQKISSIIQSKTWRYSSKLRKLIDYTKKGVKSSKNNRFEKNKSSIVDNPDNIVLLNDDDRDLVNRNSRKKSNENFVSIIMPTKNRADRIRRAISSVLDQTYKNFELIIVDDGSVDDTKKLINHTFDDDRIILIDNLGHGVAEARNSGLKISRGDWIMYLDSDNHWHDDFLSLSLYFADRAKASCFYSGLILHEDHQVRYFLRRFDFDKLVQNNFIDLNAFGHTRELYLEVGGFDVGLKRMVDWDFVLRVCKKFEPCVVPIFAVDYDHSRRSDRISVSETDRYWSKVRNKHWVNWSNVAVNTSNAVSIVMVVDEDCTDLSGALSALSWHLHVNEGDLILVSNGCSEEIKLALRQFCQKHSGASLRSIKTKLPGALAANYGFSFVESPYVVFLDVGFHLTVGSLNSLISPLEQSAEVVGCQPSVVDRLGKTVRWHFESLDSADCKNRCFDTHFSVDFLIPAVFAVRHEDFRQLNGFDPLFDYNHAVFDLAWRLRNVRGGTFVSVSDSLFVRSQFYSAPENSRISAELFVEKWNVSPPTCSVDAAELSRPLIVREKRIRVRTSCPTAGVKHGWGDYSFGVSLAAAFMRSGVDATVDFTEDSQTSYQSNDINLVLRGLKEFEGQRVPGSQFMWVISHPDKIPQWELGQFSHVFIASDYYTDALNKSVHSLSVSSLLQCTDKMRFFPRGNRAKKFQERLLFVGNSRKILRTVPRKAVEEGLDLSIYGQMWDGLVPADLIKGLNIGNHLLPSYYSAADVVFNDHWQSMIEYGFLSNRVFDVLASGSPLISDRVAQAPEWLAEFCQMFGEDDKLAPLVDRALADRASGQSQLKEQSDFIREHHSFDKRVDQILETLEI